MSLDTGRAEKFPRLLISNGAILRDLGVPFGVRVETETPAPVVDEDRHLVEKAVAGDLDAFAEIVRRHQDFVYGAVLRVVRNPTQAEDITQDTFVRAYRALPDFRGDAKLRSWLYRIGTNLALNAVTRAKEHPSDKIPDSLAPSGPAAEAELSQLAEAMRAAIADLPADLSEPLVLREFEGLSYEEIADRTGLPLNTVRTRIFRARRALATKMEEWR